ncbi:MAG: hypothetical protein GY795_26010 [Desulfobacterales bacterium]|nr:hypothetical protein [Desulfobacterales bacterium]
MKKADKSVLHLLVLFLLCYGAVRILFITAHSPMYGYSNNYDFIRLEAFHGLYPANGAKGQHLEAPISDYKLTGPINHHFFFLSSEMLFTSLALKTSLFINLVTGRPLTDFKMQTLGVIKSLFIIMSGCYLTYIFLRQSALAGLLSAAVFGFLVSDPMHTLYFNTLYYESSAFIFFYISLSLLIYRIFFNNWDNKITAMLSFSLFMLGMSKFQFFLLPFFLSGSGILCWIIIGNRINKRLFIKHMSVVLLAGLLAFGVQILQTSRASSEYMRVIKHCNLTNTFLNCFLPSMEDQEKGLKLLDLSAHCAKYIGKSWYSEDMHSLPCPGVVKLSRTRIFYLIYSEPSVLYKIFREFFSLSHEWIIFSHIEGQKNGRLDFQFFSFHWSITHYIEQLNEQFYEGLFSFSLIVAAFSCFLIFFIKNKLIKNTAILISLFSLQWIYVFLSSVFGDGFTEVGRHFYLGTVPWLICIILSISLLINMVIHFTNKYQRIAKNIFREKFKDGAI